VADRDLGAALSAAEPTNRGHCAQQPCGSRRFARYPWLTTQWLAGAVVPAGREEYAGAEGSR
jgi:hypothetical protein